MKASRSFVGVEPVTEGREAAAAGLVSRGRVAEDFKLPTSTFVSFGTLRPGCYPCRGAAEPSVGRCNTF